MQNFYEYEVRYIKKKSWLKFTVNLKKIRYM